MILRNYPRLKQIWHPTLFGYVRGHVAVLSRPGIARVSTGHPRPTLRGMAERDPQEIRGGTNESSSEQDRTTGGDPEDGWQELSENIRIARAPAGRDESQTAERASLFAGQEALSPNQRTVFALLRADRTMPMGEMVAWSGREISPSEIFAAHFERELGGKGEQVAGEEFWGRTFQLRASDAWGMGRVAEGLQGTERGE
jgi:hypothetical protein